MNKPEVSSYHLSSDKDDLNRKVTLGAGPAVISATLLAAGAVYVANGGKEKTWYVDRSRKGKDGRPATIVKVRSMKEDGGLVRLGSVVRKGLDEGLQIGNVAMSLFGSANNIDAVNYRALMPDDQKRVAEELSAYTRDDLAETWLALRKQVNPGVTGPTQIMPKFPIRSEGQRLKIVAENAETEVDYLLTGTYEDDVAILRQTPRAVLLGHNPSYPRPSDVMNTQY